MNTTIKDALENWKEKNKSELATAKEVKLNGIFPPISRIDSSISVLQGCERLSLSTNMIDRITNLNSLKNLKVLSLGRNLIKSLIGIDAVANTLEELWISYNQIEKLRGISDLKKLKILYFSHNLVKDWSEFDRLKDLPMLENLLFIGNPLREIYKNDEEWVTEVTRRLNKLKKLDGFAIASFEEF